MYWYQPTALSMNSVCFPRFSTLSRNHSPRFMRRDLTSVAGELLGYMKSVPVELWVISYTQNSKSKLLEPTVSLFKYHGFIFYINPSTKFVKRPHPRGNSLIHNSGALCNVLPRKLVLISAHTGLEGTALWWKLRTAPWRINGFKVRGVLSSSQADEQPRRP